MGFTNFKTINDMMEKYLHSTQDAGKKFYEEFKGKGSFVMLNLLKFKKEANYKNFENIKPKQEITGNQAYKMYIEKTLPFLEKFGSKVLFSGDSKHFVIGPETEEWDAVVMVEHKSVESFMQFAQDADYLKISGHRVAALEDSRLLPILKGTSKDDEKLMSSSI